MSYFTHYRGERNGTIAVIVITIIIVVVVEVVPWYELREDPEVPKVFVLLSPPEDAIPKEYPEPFVFNPNSLSDSGYLELGFTERQVKTLRNFQKAGGRFRTKKDFSKLYFLDENRYKQLEPYIDLPDRIERRRHRSNYADYERNYERKPRRENKVVQYFHFDPNTLSDSGYSALGFSPRQIESLRKFQNAGADFQTKEDFSRLYFVNEEKFKALFPYIDLPTEEEREAERKKALIVDVNTVGVEQLTKIPGIGAYYAKEIVSLRDELGGFYDLYQLTELYKMTPGRIDTLAEYLKIRSEPKRLSLRNATAQELAGHPYMDLKTASELVRWRETAIDISPESLEESGLLSDELYRKFAPYLDYR